MIIPKRLRIKSNTIESGLLYADVLKDDGTMIYLLFIAFMPLDGVRIRRLFIINNII